MRIISQNGIIDLPYENIGISINCCNKKDIVAYSAVYYGKDNGHWTLAEYSTEEKAKKAMEMLREAYAGLPIIMQNIDISETVVQAFERWKKQGIVIRTPNDNKSKVEYINNGYFRFPADEDVEV